MTMYGHGDLKPLLTITDTQVSCPVRGCETMVQRRRSNQEKVRLPEFFCEKHRIFITTSTWEYENLADNLLWGVPELTQIADAPNVKRESRIARDNSEDALTWNVFWLLRRSGLLLPWLSRFHGSPGEVEKCIFWSGDQLSDGRVIPWSPLWEARKEFEGDPKSGTESDLIVVTSQCLILIEAKFGASNETIPTHLNFPKQYVTGGEGWFRKVFADTVDYKQIAEMEKRYELMRLWLLGSWMAKNLGKDFRLISLVLSHKDKKLQDAFRPFLAPDRREHFQRATWEDIYARTPPEETTGEIGRLRRYMEEKTLGYSAGKLRRAFDFRPEPETVPAP